ncbi:hypothetical protein GOA90_25260 [Sinorhizobium meliloti]|nr:hypothetical protein [Sinorhizobium meliloti]
MTTENTIERAHEWLPARRGVRPVCRVCGAVKRPNVVTSCYVETVEPQA